MHGFADAQGRRLDDILFSLFIRLQYLVERLAARSQSSYDEIDLLKRSFLFDPTWYRDRYPAANGYVGGPYLHYLRIGWKIGYNPGPAFDGAEYLRNNPDVAAADDYNPLLHYIRHGAKEGRLISTHLPVMGGAVDIQAPADWEEVDATPVIVITSSIDALARIEYFDVSTFFADPSIAEPEVSADIFLRKTGSNCCECPTPLQDRPYVVRLTCQDQVVLRGIKVNSYQRFANNLSDFRLAQQAILGRQLNEIDNHCQTMMVYPHFRIMLSDQHSAEAKMTLASIQQQLYRHWSLYTDPSEYEHISANDWLVFLHAGDHLEIDLLYRYACVINRDAGCDLVYCDDYRLTDDSLDSPFYKPAWSPDYLESFNYLRRGATFKLKDHALLSKSASYADFVLRFTENEQISAVHIPRLLVGLSDDPSVGFLAEGCNSTKALEGRFARTRRRGKITCVKGTHSFLKVKFEPWRTPKVSIVIPTAGKTVDIDGRQVDLLLNIVRGIQADDYLDYELIIVHNGDLSRHQLQELADADARLVHFEDQDFNISKKLNLGALHARGELLLLLNDDIQPRSRSWISSMAAHLEKPHVGIVGVKLLYSDGTIQHIGVVQNYGNCDHVCRGHADGFGYYGSAALVRNYSAVTGACIMTRTATFRQLGGFNENLAVSYNDVDFCFKVRTLGLSVLCDASIELYHFESRSRVPEPNLKELTIFYETWPQALTADAFYNERMLDICPPSFRPKAKMRML